MPTLSTRRTRSQTAKLQDVGLTGTSPKTLIVRLRIPTMIMFTPLSPEDFTSTAEADHFASLSAQLKSLRAPRTISNPRPIFTAEQHVELIRVIRSLHGKIFFVKDEDGCPIKIEMPQTYAKQVGVQHLFFVEDWVDLGIPKHLTGIDWPPTSAEELLKADADEECVGCMRRRFYWEDNTAIEYGMDLKPDSCVKFRTKDGVAEGLVVRNISYKEAVLVAVYPDWHEVETHWKSLVVPSPSPSPAPSPQQGPTPISLPEDSTESEASSSPHPPCNCDIAKWRNLQQKWHKHFALRKTSPTSVGVFALTYIPANRPIGEFVGVLKPDMFYHNEDNPDYTVSSPSKRSLADVMKYRIDIPIGGQGEKEVTCFVDNFAYGNFTRFVRHSCDPSARRDEYRYGTVRMNVLFSKRPIAEGEEVTEDFGMTYLEEVGKCDCGLECCQMRERTVGGMEN